MMSMAETLNDTQTAHDGVVRTFAAVLRERYGDEALDIAKRQVSLSDNVGRARWLDILAVLTA